MELCYLDEAGHTGSNLLDPEQPYYILGGLIVTSAKWRNTADSLKAVIRDATWDLTPKIQGRVQQDPHVCRVWAKRILGIRSDWKGLSPQEQRRLTHRIEGHMFESFEIHGVDLFQGRADFEGVSLQDRLEIAEKMIAAAEEHGLDFLYARINKQLHAKRYKYPDPPDELAFMLVAEIFETYLGAAEGERTGMFIADYSAKWNDLKANLAKYQEKGTPYYHGTSIIRIIDSVHFVRSLDSPCTQLADLCTYLILQAAKGNNKWVDLSNRVKGMVKGRKAFP